MNRHQGSSFDDFLREEGIYDEVDAAAVKCVVAQLLEEGMSREADEGGPGSGAESECDV